MRKHDPAAAFPSEATGDERERAPLLVCFSHLRWGFVTQRPQHLMNRAARTYRVLFIEEPYVSGEVGSPRFDIWPQASGVTVAVPALPHGLGEADAIAAQRSLLDAHLAEERPEDLVFWYYTPAALRFSDHMTPKLIVHDCMDELSAFRDADPRLPELEGELLARADLVFTGGASLFAAKRDRHGRVHAFPSSIDKAHFAQAREAIAVPADQADIASPRLGFFGVIDERIDLDLVAGLAEFRPDWQIVMIGPVAKVDEAILPRRANLHWLGGKAYEDLPAYLAGWDVGIMPFALNQATRFISPTKTPEFLAAGVPVVSTPIADVVRPYGERGLVQIASDATQMADAAAQWIAQDKTEWLRQVDDFLADLSWDRTWAAMKALMKDAAAAKDMASRAAEPPRAQAPLAAEAVGV